MKAILTLHLIFLSMIFLVNNSDLDGYCGYDHIHYETIEEAHRNNTKILGCGPCGACSNEHDVHIYWQTRNNLTKVSRVCAVKSLLSEKWGEKCMKEQVGFTDDCNKCWMENIKCDRENCKWVCLWSLIINEPYVDDDEKLNACLQCDEDKCGPAFKKCAGANRRRSCIASDIMRDEALICTACESKE